MPRQARLDAPGVLHHVIGRGIEGRDIFRQNRDYEDFIARISRLVPQSKSQMYAWVLMPNHFHLLMRTGVVLLASVMRRLMTGYAVNFNRRYQRLGHLFQNRYKSIVCADEPYLLELVRYIHLNPLRAGLVGRMDDLIVYRWCGHAALLGKKVITWQEVDGVLGRFGQKLNEARSAYARFIEEGAGMGERPDLCGGGLVRSAGGWAAVLALRRRKAKAASDTRVLGDSDFVESVIAEAEEQERATLRLKSNSISIEQFCRQIALAHRVDFAELISGSQRRAVIEARKEITLIAVKHLGFRGAEVARHLGVTTSCINRIVGAS